MRVRRLFDHQRVLRLASVHNITQCGGEPASLVRRPAFTLERCWIIDDVDFAARHIVVRRLTRRLRIRRRGTYEREGSFAEDSDGGVPKRPESRETCAKYA